MFRHSEPSVRPPRGPGAGLSWLFVAVYGSIAGPDTTDYVLRPETLLSSDEPRPSWGGLQKMEAELEERRAPYLKE